MKQTQKKNKKSSLSKAATIAALGITAAGAVWGLSKLNPVVEARRVSRVIDGDTIKVADNTTVRLLGIDAPEESQCFFEESRKAVADLLTGQTVLLEKELSGVDMYGRLLRYVILPGRTRKDDNVLVNDYILRQGWARVLSVPPDNRYRDLLNSAQEEAIRYNRGLWAACDYIDDLSERREQNDPPPSAAYVVKGNISTRGFGKTYLVEGCDNYEKVKIDLSKGEQYFRTTKEAERAGFRRATNCP